MNAGESLYVAERKIYPREVEGRFQRLRLAAVFWLLGMYYVFPWLSWSGRQAVLFDLPARKFYVFGLAFWPQDFIYLALLLILAGLSLFFFTALAGRLWCGYACPQTVWTEVFLSIERICEGDRHRRMKLDAGPWTREKSLRKASKHALWLILALWTGFTFVGFFTPIRALGARLVPFEWGGWETFWVLFYSFATWGNAGVLREQVCKYMCPYARFQAAMFDRDTLIISYDAERGEPRGRGRKNRDSATRSAVIPNVSLLAQGQGSVTDPAAGQPEHRIGSLEHRPFGDCIDCTLCVQVCPTGIDIRRGLQYECIACGACIDACDAVMERIGAAQGLIRYTTQNALEQQTSRILRPRVLIYAALLLTVAAAWMFGVLNREPLHLDVLRDRNALYRIAADGGVENAYTLKLVNKSAQQRMLIVESADPELQPLGAPIEVEVAAEAVVNLPMTLRADAQRVHGRRDLELIIRDRSDPNLRLKHTTRFFAPEAGGG